MAFFDIHRGTAYYLTQLFVFESHFPELQLNINCSQEDPGSCNLCGIWRSHTLFAHMCHVLDLVCQRVHVM